MKPTVNVAETTAPDGAVFRLVSHDGEFFLYLNDRQVMSTTMTHSELLLANGGCDFHDQRQAPRVLIGGLGLGFSLRRALEITDDQATVHVAELLPDIIDWNRSKLNGLNDDILADPRTQIFHEDVYKLIEDAASKNSPRYDAILLDVDDGPSSLLQPHNSRIYNRQGVQLIKRSLTPRGRAAFWSATVEPTLLRNLKGAHFQVEEIPVAKHPRAKQRHHRIYLAERQD